MTTWDAFWLGYVAGVLTGVLGAFVFSVLRRHS